MLEPVTPAQRACPTPARRSAGSWSLSRAEQLGPLRRAVEHLVHAQESGHGEPDLAARVLLVVSELATNALKYGCDPIVVGVSRREEGWLVDVRDGDPTSPPGVYPHEPARIGGHGLAIVARLSTSWGWQRAEPDGDHKCVWALVPADPLVRPA